MAASVIDSLVVTLGLDSKAFAEGMKGSSEQLAAFTKRLAGMFLAVRGLEDAVGYFKDLHAQLAEIGFTSRNLGVAGTELKRLGEVSELFGGQMSDAAQSVETLQNSIFNLRYKGQLSENLMMLQRFGVAYLTASGHMREFKDIAKDAAAAIERQAKAAGLTQGERYQMALSFGFSGGIASAVAQGGKGLEAALDKAQVDQKALTEKTIQGQVALEQQLVRQHEQLEAVNSTLLSTLTPAISKLNEWMQQLVNKAIPMLINAINTLIKFFQHPPGWFAAIEDAFKQLAAVLGPNGTLLTAIGGLVAALVSLPLTLATAIGIVLGSLLDKVLPKGLIDWTSEKINDLLGPKYNPNAPGVAPGGARPHPAPPTPTAPRPASAASQTDAAGMPTSSLAGSRTSNVHIDEINITTQARDAAGIAGAIGSEMRKRLVANADQGQS